MIIIYFQIFITSKQKLNSEQEIPMVTQINLHFVKLSFPLPTYEKKGKLLLIIVKTYKRLTYKIVKNIRTNLRYRKKNTLKRWK